MLGLLHGSSKASRAKAAKDTEIKISKTALYLGLLVGRLVSEALRWPRTEQRVIERITEVRMLGGSPTVRLWRINVYALSRGSYTEQLIAIPAATAARIESATIDCVFMMKNAVSFDVISGLRDAGSGQEAICLRTRGHGARGRAKKMIELHEPLALDQWNSLGRFRRGNVPGHRTVMACWTHSWNLLSRRRLNPGEIFLQLHADAMANNAKRPFDVAKKKLQRHLTAGLRRGWSHLGD